MSKDYDRELTALEKALEPAFPDYDVTSISPRLENLSDLDKAKLAQELLTSLAFSMSVSFDMGDSLALARDRVGVLVLKLRVKTSSSL